jgi:hypothetical protein
MNFTLKQLKQREDKLNGKEVIPYEEDEYLEIVRYLNDMGFVYTHIPMETYTKSWSVKKRNIAVGVKKGFPDYVIIIPYWWVGKRHNVLLFAEIKRTKGSSTSKEQKEWIHNLKSCNQLAEIFYGAEELKQYIEALRT